MSESTPTTFERFSELPTELRLKIWRYSLPRRVVQISNRPFHERLLRWETEHASQNLRPCLPQDPTGTHGANSESKRETESLYQPLYDSSKVSSLTESNIKPILFNPDRDTIFVDDAVPTCLLMEMAGLGEVKHLALQDENLFRSNRTGLTISVVAQALMRIFPSGKMLKTVYLVLEHNTVADEEDLLSFKRFLEKNIQRCWAHGALEIEHAREKGWDFTKDDQERWTKIVKVISLKEFQEIIGIDD